MSLRQIESGSDATGGLEFYSATGGTVASSTAQQHTGPRSISMTGTASFAAFGAIGGSQGRASVWVYITSAPAANDTELFHSNTIANTGIYINTNRTISLRYSGGTIATSTGTIPLNTWCHLVFAFNYQSPTNGAYKVWVDGALEINVSGISSAVPNSSPRLHGIHASNTIYWDDFYQDNDSGLTFPGDIRVTAKLPAVDNTSGFDSGIGSGTNRYDRVSERPLSVSNGWQHAANSDAQENYTLQSASAGDVDITGATILGYTGWMYGKRGDSDARIVDFIGAVNDKTSNHTTTTVPTTTDMTQSGAIVVAFACDDDTGNTTATCTDSQGNTYSGAQSVQAASTGNRTGVRTALFIALNATPLTGADVITISHASSGASAAVAMYCAGMVTSSALDVSNSNIDSGTNAPSTGATGTLSQAESIVLAAIGGECEDADLTTLTANKRDLQYLSVMYLKDGTTGGGAASNICVGLQVAFTTLTTSFTGGQTAGPSSRDWTSVIGAYKAQTGAISLGDPRLTLNGTDYSKTLTVVNALYTEIVTSASYPSNAAGIGMRSSGTTADSFLYECGALIAYIPSAGPTTYTLTCDAGAFTLSGQDTSLLHNRALPADAGAFTLSGQDASLSYVRTLLSEFGAFNLSGQDTGLFYDRALTADVGSFALSGQDAALLFNRTIVADFGAFTLSGQDAALAKQRILTADFGAFSLSGQDASLLTSRSVAADFGAFTLNGQDAMLSKEFTLTADFGSFALTGQDASLLYDRALAADFGAFALAGQNVALFYDHVLTAEFGAFSLSGQDVALGKAFALTANFGAFSLAGQDATLLLNRVLTADVGSFALSGQDVALLTSRLLTADYGAFSLSGQDAALSKAFALVADAGSFTLSGQDAALVLSRALTADAGAFALSGQDAALLHDRTLPADAGAFTVTGQDAGLTRAFALTADAGSFVLSGQDAALGRLLTLVSDYGAFALIGQDATLTHETATEFTLTADAGSFVLSGQDATLLHHHVLTADVGAFALTGQEATIGRALTLTADAGSFALSGQDAALLYDRVLIGDPGIFTLSGQAVVFTYSGIASITVRTVSIDDAVVYVLDLSTTPAYSVELDTSLAFTVTLDDGIAS